MRGTPVLRIMALVIVIASLSATAWAQQPAATQPKPATEGTKAANPAVRHAAAAEVVWLT